MDGVALAQGTEFVAQTGSILITLKQAYLQTLPVGTHTFTVTLQGGALTGTSLSQRLEVVAPPAQSAAAGASGRAGTPGTGDSQMPGGWAVGMIAGAGVLVALWILRVRRKESRRF